MKKKIKWGFIGCGAIAKAFAHGLSQTDSGEVIAVSSRTREGAAKFASEHKIPKSYATNEELLADKEVDIVYISTQHITHAELSIKAAEAGKHILCEKPMALNHADAMTVLETVRRCGVFFMEAFMYRCHPQTQKLLELVRENAVGEIRLINGSFGFGGGTEFNPASRIYNRALAGGGIMDVGCYPVSMARLIAGAKTGKPFANPVKISGTAHIGAVSLVDEWAAADLTFASGLVAQVSTGVRVTLENNVRLFGADGTITVSGPWTHDRVNPFQGKIIVHKKGSEPIEISVPTNKTAYALEADMVAAHLEARQAPVMTWDDSLGNLQTLDSWREAAGLVFDAETVSAYSLPVSKKPLSKRVDSFMKYGRLAGIDKPVSRLIMGVDNQTTIAHATAMFDDFFERGGNCFDTAWVYATGKREAVFGQWLSNRKNRNDIVLIAKGAHTPFCNPKSLLAQFDESLGRLQTDHTDIYFMHRDNPEIPVGEFIDALNALYDKGRLRVFGASNWTLSRIREANGWAAKNGKKGFGAVSNNFSLARMINPIWTGCVASTEPEYFAWHCETKIPVFAWSSQARGFFVPGLAAPDKRDNMELVNCWYSDDNFERRKRCFELAEKKGVQPINIALAYVLHQPFDTFALIGPRTIAETASSFEGLKVKLTEQQVRWLNLETPSL